MEEPAFRLATALAIGLLIGAERERRKAVDPEFSSAGIRTFAIAALLGGASVVLGGYVLLAVTILATAGVSSVAYLRSTERDRGTTTEVALLLTVTLGGLAQQMPAIASGAAVVVAILLAARAPLHHFVGVVLTKEEATDALIFAAATLVVLPLIPNRYLGPLQAINPRTVWVVVVLMISISALGYILVRWLGARVGLPLAGFASGFVSSAATIGAMGERALNEPAIARSAVAGAVASNVATMFEMAIVVAAISVSLLRTLATALVAGGLATVAYAGFMTVMSVKQKSFDLKKLGRAFSLKSALGLAAIISFVMLGSAVLNGWLGERGLVLAAGLAGFADTHSAAISVASLVAAGKITPHEAALPIIIGLTTNTVTKALIALWSGGRQFTLQVVPGLVLMLTATWVGLGVSH